MFLRINYLIYDGFPHLHATSVCPNVLRIQEGAAIICENSFGYRVCIVLEYRKTLLTFVINELCVRGSRRRFYYLKKQLTRCIQCHSKIVTYKFKVELSLCETVARRRRIFFRISASKLYFVKENKRGNSPPQAKIFKDLRC